MFDQIVINISLGLERRFPTLKQPENRAKAGVLLLGSFLVMFSFIFLKYIDFNYDIKSVSGYLDSVKLNPILNKGNIANYKVIFQIENIAHQFVFILPPTQYENFKNANLKSSSVEYLHQKSQNVNKVTEIKTNEITFGGTREFLNKKKIYTTIICAIWSVFAFFTAYFIRKSFKKLEDQKGIPV